MLLENREIKLGLSSVFDWSVWRSNELHTKRTLNTIQKEKSRFHSEYTNVTTALDTIIAFLQSALLEERLHCPKTHKSILDEDPKHINALTDMTSAHLASKSEKLKHVSAFSKDPKDPERHYIIGKACLELGMALVEFEEIVDFEQLYTQRDRNEHFK